MILVNEMPKSGQFVAVWEFAGKVWSDTYRWENGNLMEFYEDDCDGMWDIVQVVDHLKGAVFAIAEGTI